MDVLCILSQNQLESANLEIHQFIIDCVPFVYDQELTKIRYNQAHHHSLDSTYYHVKQQLIDIN